ncbi:hypothetical protein M501DRAFT_938257 [Patellaria atrata CBS 101060]|uniref:Pentatricopeptide repeat-containing protein-mitochondrial domain-containing protein n=1 Tax=Patellaria atrata CBS 101060 TaxID=1346257 RepID=A0A9P4S6Q5_9PEZI|nr:hypothetical protein M501DRAFT_938257 [Patellaria atrata CBS 101060]
MQAPFIIDGLSRALCPSFSYALPLVKKSPPNALRVTTACRRKPRPHVPRFQWRPLATATSTSVRRPSTLDFESKSLFHQAPKALANLETEEVYTLLRKRALDGQNDIVDRIIENLVQHRREPPNLKIYSALILRNVNTSGSAQEVVAILHEMKEEGVALDARTCHDVLKVLSVHPHYVLRADIIEYMRQRWFTITEDGHHDIVAGLLRERQFELALHRMDLMVEDNIRIQDWLLDMATYSLLQVGEIDKALDMVKDRTTEDSQLTPSLWYYFLEVASSAFHHEGTSYVWNTRVQTNYLNPPSGACLNVLTTAARYGDVELATDVFRVFGMQNTVIEHQHYEMLIDTYMAHGDVSTALSILCVMHSANAQPDEGTTRTIYEYLRQDVERPPAAFKYLHALKEEDRDIPVSAVNCIIEASTRAGLLNTAIEQYKNLRNLCNTGPNIATFNVLLQGCRKLVRKDLAMFLAAEMVALKIKPDQLTYDRLVLVCSNHGDTDDALRYCYEMKAEGFALRAGTFAQLIRGMRAAQDPRIEQVQRELNPDNSQSF